MFYKGKKTNNLFVTHSLLYALTPVLVTFTLKRGLKKLPAALKLEGHLERKYTPQGQ